MRKLFALANLLLTAPLMASEKPKHIEKATISTSPMNSFTTSTSKRNRPAEMDGPLSLRSDWSKAIIETPEEETHPILKVLRRRPSKDPFPGPVVPEPMVFDLVRPLHARAGEAEMNVLALVNSDRVDWAPEVEIALDHGFAIEFELPMEDNRLESYKLALQQTIGTAFDDQLIHGLHGILEYERETHVWRPTLVHVTGVRIDETWSTLTMIGGRTRIGGNPGRARTDFLLNASLFADLSEALVFGIESNLAVPLGDNRVELLLMPQFHVELGENLQLQAGYGTRHLGRTVRGEAGVRLIWEF